MNASSTTTAAARQSLNALIVAALSASVLMLGLQTIEAGSATWSATPSSTDWNTAGNWTPGGPPNGAADTATFAFSNTTALLLSANTEVNSIVFNSGASEFTITAPPMRTLTISGVGITNNSGMTQNFITAVDESGNHGTINFTNSATAGSLTAFTNSGQLLGGNIEGGTQFFGTSTAGNATFTNNGPTVVGGFGGRMRFLDSSTAPMGSLPTTAARSADNQGALSDFSAPQPPAMVLLLTPELQVAERSAALKYSKTAQLLAMALSRASARRSAVPIVSSLYSSIARPRAMAPLSITAARSTTQAALR